MATALIGVAVVLGDFGLSMAAIQSQTITHAQRSNLFWSNAAIGLILFACVFFAAPLVAAFYGEPDLVDVTRALSVTFLLNSLSAQFRAEVSSKLRFRWLAAADLGGAAGGLIVAIVLAMLGAGLWAIVAQQVAVGAVTLATLVLGARWMPSLPTRHASMGSLYKFGANTLGVQLLNYATSNADSILIGRVWGAGPLGVYDRAFRLFRLPLQQIAAPMTKVALPVLSKLQDDRARYDAYLQRAQLVLAYGFGGSFMILAGVSGPLIEVLLGPGWDEAKPIFAALAVGGVFQGIGYVYYWVFLSRALTALQLRWAIVTKSLSVILMGFGVVVGPLGVAVAVSVGQAMNWLLLTIFPMRHAQVNRKALIAAAIRPIVFLTPFTIVSAVTHHVWLHALNPLIALAVYLSAALLYIAAGTVLPGIRRDYRDLVQIAKHLRR